MRDEHKTREQLIEELETLRRRLWPQEAHSDAHYERGGSTPDVDPEGNRVLRNAPDLVWNPEDADLPILEDVSDGPDVPRFLPSQPDARPPGGHGLSSASTTESGSYDLTWITMASFGKLLDAVPMPILLASSSGQIRLENYALMTASGQLCSMAGKSLYALFPDSQETARAQELVAEVLNKRTARLRQGILVINDKQIWTRMHLRSIRFGSERSVLVLIEDLTAEKRELSVFEKYKKLVDVFPIGIAEFAFEESTTPSLPEDELVSAILNARFVDGNAHFAQLHGHENMANLTGAILQQILPLKGNELECCRQWIRDGFSSSRFETKEASGDERSRYFETTLVGNVKGDAPLHFWVMKQEITERKKVQDELLQKIRTIDALYEHIVEQGKAKAISEHTATVAHELRQPLAIIGGFARRMAKACEECEHSVVDSQDKWFQVITREVLRLERILTGLIDFTKRDAVILEKVNPNELIQYILAIHEERMKEKSLRFELDLGPELGGVSLDPDRFQQVIRNLLANAIEASPHNETIRVKTGVAILSDQAKATGELDSEMYFEIRMHNRGEPIPKEHLEKIFNPFFTTKDYGTGLGLTLSKKIVEDHRGSISVKSDSNGTMLTVWLPMKQSSDETVQLSPDFVKSL